MYKSNYKKYVMAIILTLLLTSCTVDMPEEVKQDADTLASVQGGNTAAVPEYATLQQIQDSVEQVRKTNYGAVKLPKSIQIPKSVAVLNLKQHTGNFNNPEEIVSLFINPTDYKKEYLSPFDSQPPSYLYINPNTLESVSFNDSGLTYFFIGEISQSNKGDSSPIVKVIHVDRNEDYNVSYRLKDGDVTVKDAISFINGYLAEKWGKFDKDFDCIVKTVYVRKMDGERYCYEFAVERQYKGMPIYSTAALDTNRTYLPFMSLSLFMESSGRISSFHADEIYNIADAADLGERLVTLDSALKLIQNRLTSLKIFELSDISLTSKIIHDGGQIKTSPLWLFTFDAAQSELQDADGQVRRHGLRREIQVNALTGEITDYLDPSVRTYF